MLREAIGVVLLATALGAAADPEPVPARSPCDPLETEPPGHLDLQQAARWACRAVAGDARTDSALASRLRVRVGGWIDGGYLDNDLAGQDASIDVDNVNLHLDARLEELQLFVEGEYEHEHDIFGLPDSREVELEQAYLDYALEDALKLRGGKFATPFGYWTPVHWSINVDTIEPPIYEASRVVPEQQLGGRLHGRLFPRIAPALEPSVEYSGTLGYSGEDLDTGKAEGLTGGADLRLWSADRHFLGVSYYGQKNGHLSDRRENNLMLYGQLALPARLLFRTEYLHQWRSHRPGYTRNADIVYAKLRWDFYQRAYLNYRFGYGQDDRYGFTADHRVHTITLGYRPIARVIAKAETAFHQLDHGLEDYVAWGATLGLIF